jgi:hypothetical protein
VSLWFRRLYKSVLQRDTNVGTGTLVPRVPSVMMMAASVQSPRARDGWTCGVAHNGTGYCAHRPEHDGTRQGTQCRVSGALLSAHP